MKAISIQQPWAWAILHAEKNIENRTWGTSYRGRIVVHAGKKIDPEGMTLLRKWGFDVPENLPTGCLLGEIDITGCVDQAHGPTHIRSLWAFGPYCWTLANPIAYPEPIPCLGKLGIFEVEVAS